MIIRCDCGYGLSPDHINDIRSLEWGQRPDLKCPECGALEESPDSFLIVGLAKILFRSEKSNDTEQPNDQ